MPEPPLVLVTRSEPGASETAQRLEAEGLKAVLTPMLAIVDLPITENLEGIQALLVTSAHAARRLRDAPKPLPRVLTVGGATADAARVAGAGDVISVDGDVDALAALARRTLDPQAGAVLHWRGRDVAGDIAGALRAAGFTVREHQVYAAEPRRELAPEARHALEDGSARAVLFHSARGTRAFVEAVARAGLTDRLSDVIAASLSRAAGAPGSATAFAAHVAAAQPLEKSLIEALIQALKSHS